MVEREEGYFEVKLLQKTNRVTSQIFAVPPGDIKVKLTKDNALKRHLGSFSSKQMINIKKQMGKKSAIIFYSILRQRAKTTSSGLKNIFIANF